MNVCPECFENSILKWRIKEIRPKFPDDEKCDFHPTRKAVPLEEVGRIVDPALRANYGIGEWMFDHQDGDSLDIVIASTTGADDDQVVEGLVDWLVENDFYWPPDGDEPFYGTDQSYVLIKPDGWQHSLLWRRFRQDILYRQRFFNDAAKEFLAEIFEGIQNQTDAGNKPAFYRIDPLDEVEFHRARIAATDDEYSVIRKRPAAEMAPPPPNLRRAGRMNAAGIPVLYGALERETAIAELRPAVGSLIYVAKFKLRRPIYVLDLTRFKRSGKQIDIFAKNQLKRAQQWAFMQSFAVEISQPILPNDEHLDYVPSQVVAEYLTRQPIRWRKEEIVPDAIIFRSAQNAGGNNIAIMGDAANVFVGSIETASAKADEPVDEPYDLGFSEFVPHSPAAVNPGLEYVDRSLERVEVTSAKYKTKEYFASLSPFEPDF